MTICIYLLYSKYHRPNIHITGILQIKSNKEFTLKKKSADQKKKEMAVKNMKYEITSTTYLISRMVFLLWNASFRYLASCNWEVGLLFDMIKANSSKFLHTYVYD